MRKRKSPLIQEGLISIGILIDKLFTSSYKRKPSKQFSLFQVFFIILISISFLLKADIIVGISHPFRSIESMVWFVGKSPYPPTDILYAIPNVETYKQCLKHLKSMDIFMSFSNIIKVCTSSDKDNTKEVHCLEPLQWNDIILNCYHNNQSSIMLLGYALNPIAHSHLHYYYYHN